MGKDAMAEAEAKERPRDEVGRSWPTLSASGVEALRFFEFSSSFYHLHRCFFEVRASKISLYEFVVPGV